MNDMTAYLYCGHCDERFSLGEPVEPNRPGWQLGAKAADGVFKASAGEPCPCCRMDTLQLVLHWSGSNRGARESALFLAGDVELRAKGVQCRELRKVTLAVFCAEADAVTVAAELEEAFANSSAILCCDGRPTIEQPTEAEAEQARPFLFCDDDEANAAAEAE